MNTPVSHPLSMPQLNFFSGTYEEASYIPMTPNPIDYLNSASGSFNYSFGASSSPLQLPGMNSIMSFLMRDSLPGNYNMQTTINGPASYTGCPAAFSASQ